ncbi:MAG TPA: tyrosine-type recombinase/integrase [Roseiarcus sp.]|jgi:integrase
MKTVKTTLTRVEGADGLFLKRTPAGARSYIYRYRVPKTERKREIALGGVGEIEAKMAALAFAAQRQKGVDPADAHKAAKAEKAVQAKVEAKKTTFRAATEAYVDRNAPDWKHAYARANWLNPIRRYAYPVIGDLFLDTIEIEHVTAIVERVRKFPGTARRVRQHIALILDDATRRGLRSATIRNPADPKLHRGARKRGEGRHYRRVKLTDAPSVFRRIHELAADSTALSAWVFLIATATRGSEALKARWGEIDLDKKLWAIPPARMKNDRAHVVPLSSLAIAVLKRQKKVRTGDAVFPGSGGSPLSYDPFAKAPARAGIDAGTPHSWRSVFRDACGDKLRVDFDLAEAALSHTLPTVQRAYRHETAIEARRPVMEAYAQWLIGEGADVIAFPARA